jgi:hypothetical protein
MNPFDVTAPLSSAEQGVRRPELDVTFEQALSGVHVVVTGPRRIGKTSALLSLASAASDAGRQIVMLDAAADGLARPLVEDALRASSLSEDPSSLVVLDNVEAAGVDLAGLGALAEAVAPATFLLAGSDTAGARDAASVLEKATGIAPTLIELGSLAIGPSKEFLESGFAGCGIALGKTLDSLIDLAGGHPQRMMLMASYLWAVANSGVAPTEWWPQTVERTLGYLGESFEQRWSGYASDAERNVLRALAEGSSSLFSTRTLERYALTKASASRARDRLVANRTLTRDDNDYRFAEPLYREWIASGRRPAGATRELDPPRARRYQLAAPFGISDGARAEFLDITRDFVPVRFSSASANLSDASDMRVRVVVGRKGSGKTLYLRRLHAAHSHNHQVYADPVSMTAPSTEEVVRVNAFYGPDAVESWQQLWHAAILRSVASHLLRNSYLAGYAEIYRDSLEEAFVALGGRASTPRSIGAELREIMGAASTKRSLDSYLRSEHWGELAYYVGAMLSEAPPLAFYMDALDDEFARAPRDWLACQQGLFSTVMRLLRDPVLGGRLHVVVALRDNVLSSVLRSEHGTRFMSDPHIAHLAWDSAAIRQFLAAKVSSLPGESLMAREATDPLVAWLGRSHIDDPLSDAHLEVADFLLDHTRGLPRDVIIQGNELCAAIDRARSAGRLLTDAAIAETVHRTAVLFGREQLAIVANQITAGVVAAGHWGSDLNRTHDFAEPYAQHVETALRATLAPYGAGAITEGQLRSLGSTLDERFGAGVEAPAVLWLSGMLGVVAGDRIVFYEDDDRGGVEIPHGKHRYVLHPVVRAVLANSGPSHAGTLTVPR